MRFVRLLTPVALVSLAVVAVPQYPGTKPIPSDLRRGFDAITIPQAKTWLEKLSGPEFAGRGTGQAGYQKAAEWMADRFKELGLKPAGDKGTYFQGVPFTSFSADASKTTLKMGDATLQFGKDYSLTGVTADFTASGPILVAELTPGAAPDFSEDERKALANSIVVVSGPEARRLAQAAIRGGAKLALTLKAGALDAQPTIQVGHEPRPRPRTALSGAITEAAWRGLQARLGAATAVGTTLRRFAAEGSVAAAVKADKIMVPNVVAKLEGSDPVLKEEIIGIGAHLDHLGISDGVVYPGADDDGSGSTSLLLIAKAMQANRLKPKRSIVFMAFTGEEMGLLGSSYLVNNPPFPLAKMACLLQMDMVGRNEEKAGDLPADNVRTIHLVGSKRISSELHEATLKANEHIGFTFEWDEEGVYTRSDHAVFAAKGIPITFLFSGFHPDYHRPTDTIEKINFDKLTNAAKLNYLVAHTVAAMPAMPKRDVAQAGG